MRNNESGDKMLNDIGESVEERPGWFTRRIMKSARKLLELAHNPSDGYSQFTRRNISILVLQRLNWLVAESGITIRE